MKSKSDLGKDYNLSRNTFRNFKHVKIYNKFLVFAVICIVIISNAEVGEGLPHKEFKNGQFYKITSLATGKAMSVDGKKFRMENTDIVTQHWIAQDNQVWLALAESTQTDKPVSKPEKFILLPQRQSWEEWREILEKGRINKNMANLPDNAVVLTLDNSVVNLTQSVFNDTSNQKWVTESAEEDDYVLIKNWGNQQCIKNFDFKTLNLLERVRKRIDTFFGISRKKKASPLGTLECNPSDATESWLLEPVYALTKG